MRLPKFWRDKGAYNDTLVSLSTLTFLGAATVANWKMGWSGTLALGLLAVALILGYATGFLLAGLLCKYFVKSD